MSRFWSAIVVSVACVCSTEALAQTPASSTPAPAQPAAGVHRWFDVQTLLFSTRYRHIETSADVVTANQMQHNELVKARFTFDAAGRLAIVGGLASGASFTSGWNNGGIGTPDDLALRMYLKQLYISAAPVKGVEAQFGGLYIIRGETTEIIGYDNDGYITGERLSIKRPDRFGLDEISATIGFLGDTTIPNFLRRTDRLSETNYYHVLGAKKFSSEVSGSADFTRVSGVRTLRSAVSIKAPATLGLDLIRVEAYRRFDNAANGYTAFGEKKLAPRLTAGLGVADIDLNNGTLNSDRFGKGRRWYLNGTLTLFPELALQTFYQHAFNNDVALTNRSRFEIILQFNALKAMQRARWY